MSEPRYRHLGWTKRKVHAQRLVGDLPPGPTTLCGQAVTRVGRRSMSETMAPVTCASCQASMIREREVARGEGLSGYRLPYFREELRRAGYYGLIRERCGTGYRLVGSGLDIRTEQQVRDLLAKGWG